MKRKTIAAAAAATALTGVLAGIARTIRNNRREKAGEVVRKLLAEESLPETVMPPPQPSVEFSPTSIAHVTGLETVRGQGNLIAVMETAEGRRIALVDRPEHKIEWYFRNRRNPHGTDLTLALDASWLTREEPAPFDHPLQHVLNHCRWLNAGPRRATGWHPYELVHEADQPDHAITEAGWCLWLEGKPLEGKYDPGNSGIWWRDYPRHVILETPDGRYRPIRRKIMDSSEVPGMEQDGHHPVRLVSWEGRNTPSWEQAVRDLYLQMGWRAQPGMERTEEEPERFLMTRIGDEIVEVGDIFGDEERAA